MKRLGERPDIVQCRLRDLLHLLQVFAQGRSFRGMFARAGQHRSERCQNLPEFIVEFARNVPQCRFLCRDQFLRQITALLGKLRQAGKNLPVTANQVQACQNNGDERCGQENIELPLHTIVNLRDARGGLLFTFVVSHQKP